MWKKPKNLIHIPSSNIPIYYIYSHILSIVKNQLSWSGFTYSHTLSIIPILRVYIYMYMIVLTVLLAILLVKIQYSHMLQQCYNCLNPVCYSHCIYMYIHHIIILLGIILVGIASYLYIYLFPYGGFLKSRYP